MEADYTFYHCELPDDEVEGNAENPGKENTAQIEDEKKKKLPCGHSYYDHVWFDKPQKPIILESGKKSDKIYFVLSGPVYIMDPDCELEYGVLYTGSYFGEISAFFDEPNQFSYAYNTQQRHPSIQCLAVDAKKFMCICRKYPISFENLLQRAYKRKKMFQ